ncbi:hypothetical protein NEFER03_0504 [Nematocida sp. LUAm3]|nr:hypothetical protein NEFER03_0504 [Nematocida sp. LUAm3]KAI5175471.1 hypothetical protein NEFER02_1377 [Nematocida sp. LUAm2]KAI5178499.1 hypothetical protein NEFER01_1646 [Nematocida sp. LUAm1]
MERKESLRNEEENLSALERFSEEEVLAAIRKRYENNQIYTYAGPSLISVNPNREIGVFAGMRIPADEDKPHIFSIAEKAYREIRYGKDQAIILSGESGSGKTVNANYIVEYLSKRSLGTAETKEEEKKEYKEESEVGKKLLYSGSILEAFGNACTKNNPNSSRFGRYVEIFYSKERMVRASIKAFLLEKGRVSSQESFHIIMICRALLEEKREKKEETKRIKKLVNDMQQLGINRKTIQLVFRVIFFTVHIIGINPESPEEEELKKAKALLQIDPKELIEMLTTRRIEAGKEVIIKKKTSSEISTSKDTLVRYLYEKTFMYLVEKINEKLSDGSSLKRKTTISNEEEKIEDINAFIKGLYQAETHNNEISREIIGTESYKDNSSENHQVISLLDIYGFEILEENSLDQLCINYANEKLQADYIKRVIQENKKAFEEEGIPIESLENLPQAEALFEGGLGIIRLLDEESFLPGGSAIKWLQKLSSLGSLKRWDTQLEIEHYAGKVLYEAKDFVENNRNTYSDVLGICNKMSAPFLWTEENFKGKLTKTGVAGEFQKSLNSLLSHLSKCSIHYVRCIKPGKNKEYSEEYVSDQLKFSGVFETVKIFMMGFFIKIRKEDFQERYLQDAPREGSHVGNHYIFLKEKSYHELEEKRRVRNESTRVLKEYLRGRVEFQRAVNRKLQEIQIAKQKEEQQRQVEIEEQKKRLEEERKRKETEESLLIVSAQTDEKEEEHTQYIPDSKQSPVIDNFTETYLLSTPEGTVNEDLLEVASESTSDGALISVEKKDLLAACVKCIEMQERYSFQVVYLTEKEREIEQLSSHVKRTQDSIKEKDSLIKELSHKIELLLYEISNSEYFTNSSPKQSPNLHAPALSTASKNISEHTLTTPSSNTPNSTPVLNSPLDRPLSSACNESPSSPMVSGEYSLYKQIDSAGKEERLIFAETFKKICKIFIQNIPSSYATYYFSVGCAFALFRVCAISSGGISKNIDSAIRAFESSARTVLMLKKTSVPSSVGFFIVNSLFISRTFPSVETSDMVQGIFFEGCRALSDEIIRFGMEFLFKSSQLEGTSILSRLLKKPTIDSVSSHIRMIHSVLSGMFVPSVVIVSLFEYIAKVIDAQGFEHILQSKKKFSAKQLIYLDQSLDSLSSLFSDLGVDQPSRHFIYLNAFLQFVSLQREEVLQGPICLQLGIFSSLQTLAVINSLSEEVKSPSLLKLEQALKSTEGTMEKPSVPFPYLSIPLDSRTDDPNLLYSALCFSPEKKQLIELLHEYNLPYNWLQD